MTMHLNGKKIANRKLNIFLILRFLPVLSSQTITTLHCEHTFDGLVYILDPLLQDSKKVPKYGNNSYKDNEENDEFNKRIRKVSLDTIFRLIMGKLPYQEEYISYVRCQSDITTLRKSFGIPRYTL